NALVVVLLADHPAKSITSGIWLAVIEGIHGPNALQAGSFEKLRAIQRVIPFVQINRVEIQRAICGGIKSGRDPLLVFEFTVFDLIAGGTIGNDVAIADEPCRSHSKRFEDALAEKLIVGLTGDLVDQNTEEKVICIAVVPSLPGSRFYGQCLDLRYEFIFCEIKPHIERTLGTGAILGFVLGEAGSMREQIFDEDRLPGCGRVGKVLGNTVVERNLAFLHQHHDGSRNELFANRTRLKDRLWLDWHV